MAFNAQKDQEKRIVEVNRLNLIDILSENEEKHIRQYEAALKSYKRILLEKLDTAFKDAQEKVSSRHQDTKKRVQQLNDTEIKNQRDSFILVDEIRIEMKVPRSYEKQYSAAIDMAMWDVRETLELSYSEFNCFVRDQWDWKSDFEEVSNFYSQG